MAIATHQAAVAAAGGGKVYAMTAGGNGTNNGFQRGLSGSLAPAAALPNGIVIDWMLSATGTGIATRFKATTAGWTQDAIKRITVSQNGARIAVLDGASASFSGGNVWQFTTNVPFTVGLVYVLGIET